MKIYIAMQDIYKNGTAGLQILKDELINLGFMCDFFMWEEYENLKDCVVLPLGIWDYSIKLDKFLNFLDFCKLNNIILINDENTIRKNLNKSYLLDIKDAVKSSIIDIKEIKLKPNQIIKPLVGQSGNGVARFKDKIDFSFYGDKALVQDYIKHDSEACLVFFKGVYQYSILRTKNNDFRANYNYGVKISNFNPSDELISLVNRYIPKDSFYARCDVFLADKFYINEIECIEPALYFDKKPEFASVFAKLLKKHIYTLNLS